MARLTVGGADEYRQPDAMKAALAEFIGMFLFVFAGVGSAMAFAKLGGPILTPAGLVQIALAHGIALFVVIAATANISGGHINPAVTFGLAVGGHITIARGVLYWIAQLLGSVLAALVLKFTFLHEAVPIHAVGAHESVISALVIEIVTTFALIFTVYGTAVDHKRGVVGTIAPIAIGFIVLANILAAGPFSGGSMNPARSFGPALVTFDWTNHWIYWVGPLIGGGLAGLVYNEILITPPPPEEY
ncbi:hypothetical protein SELMODRAFT_165035 [Selaginella moellendorffii]|uniref:Uncharacterized protein n=1 Tax=Selaginella moellendorffii TaxID=88036 RepID=D8QSE5_SELML|nr:aquaporin TIP2-1 [Selaginella moellendorffii]XP_002965068.1 aquaporin TIP2-1 [Selaginella moellendorffii]EFJ33906.1 hypothetical protein SELMODRAFT_438995 [Selaginella moellendorffii]EFJ37418.1 hypothetical protein SELMODRAFT_165035 [Selaginella moellendorffii]|eukprot:XP_002962158.1 aquaporin TIP2-1 [Selaginella moellendorffii]